MRFLPAAALLWGLSLGCTSAASALKEADFALIHACATGDLQTARMLVSQGADVNARTPVQGGTALMLAAMKGKLKLVELLLANGAEVNASSPEGNTAYKDSHFKCTTRKIDDPCTSDKSVFIVKSQLMPKFHHFHVDDNTVIIENLAIVKANAQDCSG